jgi:hypothetical protein
MGEPLAAGTGRIPRRLLELATDVAEKLGASIRADGRKGWLVLCAGAHNAAWGPRF